LPENVVDDPSRRLRVAVAVLSGILLFDQGKSIFDLIFTHKENLSFWGATLLLISSPLSFIYALGNIGDLSLQKQFGQFFLGWTIFCAIQML
jgi:hypothetical protein